MTLECPSCHAPLPDQPARFCTGCGYDLSGEHVVSEPLFRPGPPPAAWPAAQGYDDRPPAGYGDSQPPGYGQAPPPGYGQGPPLGYGQGPPLGYGDGPTAGYGSTAALDYGDLAAPGPPAPAGYGYSDPLGYGDGAAPGGWAPAPGPLSRPPGAGSAQRPGGPRRPRAGLIAAVIVVIVIVLGAGGWLLLGHRHSGSPGSPGQNTAAAGGGKASGKAKSGAESEQLARLSGLLQQSHAARSRVVRATAGVGGCSMDPTAGIGLMNQSIRQRQKVLGQLRSSSTSAIPGGGGLVSDLQQVLRHSVAADRDFIGWMQEIQAHGKCPVNTRRSTSYQAGLAASGQADRAKSAFLARWNPLASKFGKPTYNAGSI
ncbi:MAG TPA: zinc ribbon domain-containing protein [Streptosporangiaceae bacterium]|jgi:hypothetical protein